MRQVINLALFKISVLLPIIAVFAVTNSGPKNLLIGVFVIFFALFIPGAFWVTRLKISQKGSFEFLVLGTTLMAGLALLVHPILGLFGLSKFTALFFVFVGFVIFVLNLKQLIRLKINFDLKNSYLISLLLIPFGIWVGRQADVVPINNFDQYSVPPDIYHHLSIAAEIGNHGPQIYPYVAGSGVALQYHWGAFSLGSFFNLGGLIPLPIAMYRIEFVLLSFLLLLLLYFTGKSIGKSVVSGVIASTLGLVTLYPSYDISDGLRVPLIRTGSISQLAAVVFFVAALRIFFDICEKYTAKFTNIFTLTILVMATTLSKGPTGLLLMGILGLTSLFLFAKKKYGFGLKLISGPLIGFTMILPIIFTFGPTKSSGMSLWISPLDSVKTILGYYDQPATQNNLLILTLILGVSCVTPLLFILLKLKSGPIYLAPMFIAILIGISGLFLFEAWGNSQWFVYYPVAPLVALCVAVILPKVINEFSSIQLITFIFLGLFAQHSLFILLRNWFDPNTLILGLLWVVALLFVTLTSFLIALNMWDLSFKQSLIAASITLLFVGFFSAIEYKDNYPYPVSNYEHPWSITIGTNAAANFIKNNSSVDDVLATNRHCVGPEESDTCISRIFTLSALAERRTFVEGWAYTTCPVSEALYNQYWNQPLLSLNQKVVIDSELNAAEEINNYGVNWLVIDLRRPHNTDYSNIATKEFSSGEVQVWKLKDFGIKKQIPTYTGCKSS